MILTETERERHFTADEVGIGAGDRRAGGGRTAQRPPPPQGRGPAPLARSARRRDARSSRHGSIVASCSRTWRISPPRHSWCDRAHVYEWDARTEGGFRPRAVAGRSTKDARALAPESVDVRRRQADTRRRTRRTSAAAILGPHRHAAARMSAAGEQDGRVGAFQDEVTRRSGPCASPP